MNFKKKFKKHWPYLFCAVMAMTVIGIIYDLKGVTPFGDKSLLTIDFFHQYGPMLGELYDRVRGGGNLIYSFTMGMGIPFFRNFFNYLSSPFNILMFLFNHNGLLTSFSVIIACKAVCSVLFMFMFLRKKVKVNNYMLIALSLMYGFSAYFSAYYFNIMWLDGMVFLPLICLGVEKLIFENKPLLYVCSLALLMFANYFIAYMVCIFLVIYFIILIVSNKKLWNKKTIFYKLAMFVINSLITAGICAFFLLPLYKGLMSISATSDAFPSSQYYSFTFVEFLAGHFTGIMPTVLSSDVSNSPNVSCGILAIAAFILFLFNPKIEINVKVAYVWGLILLFISFYFGQIDFIWHGFHVPNDLPFRYSFVYTFLLIVIAALSIEKIKSLKFRWISITYGIMLLLILGLQFYSKKYENISQDMIWLNLVVITIYYLLAVLKKYFKKMNMIAMLGFVFVVSLEIIAGMNENLDITQIKDSFYEGYSDEKTVLNKIKEENSDFYRLENLYTLSFNDPSWYGYYGVSTFSSMAYENMAVLQHNLGMPGNEINSYYYKQNTPIYDSIFDVKYFIGNNKDDTYYEKYDYDKLDVYKNKNLTNLLYLSSSGVKFWNYNNYNPFSVQNNFVLGTTGIDQVLERIEITSKDEVYNDGSYVVMKYEINPKEDNVYFYNNSTGIDFMLIGDELYYNSDDYNYVYNLKNINIMGYNDYNEKYIINYKANKSKVTFYVGYNNYFEYDFFVYKLNQDKFKSFLAKINENEIKIISFKEDCITASVSSESEQTVFTSIPYDEGWHVYVNDREVSTFKIGNALLGFDLDAGDHEIVLKYKIPYFNLGLFISFSCLVLLSLEIYLLKRKPRVK